MIHLQGQTRIMYVHVTLQGIYDTTVTLTFVIVTITIACVISLPFGHPRYIFH
jgi:hypothetical protein